MKSSVKSLVVLALALGADAFAPLAPRQIHRTLVKSAATAPEVKISAKDVKTLRELTDAGMMKCKEALTESGGDMEKAQEWLRAKGLSSAGKKADRATTEGIIADYVHTGSRLGVMVEVNCETDFVAKGEKFQELGRAIAMQLAASPTVEFVTDAEIDDEVKERERQAEMMSEDLAGKPDNIKEKMVEGRLGKILKSKVLLDQPYIRDPSMTVSDLIKGYISQLGENIQVARFERFNLGEGGPAKEEPEDLNAAIAETLAATAADQEKAAPAPAPAPAPAAEKSAPAVKVSAKDVKALRELTDAAMMKCKEALAESGGDMEKAQEWLRAKGLSTAGKKADRATSEGVIATYVHTGSRLGVMVEVNCETDFVAKGDKFAELARAVAMQLAASPTVEFVRADEIDDEVKERERQAEMNAEDLAGKPDNIKEKMVEGRLGKILKTKVLLDQPYIRDPSMTVDELIKGYIATIGENIQVARFSRFNLGETSTVVKEEEDLNAAVADAIAQTKGTEEPAAEEVKEEAAEEAAPAVVEEAEDEVKVWAMVKDLEDYNAQLIDFIKSKGLEVPELK